MNKYQEVLRANLMLVLLSMNECCCCFRLKAELSRRAGCQRIDLHDINVYARYFIIENINFQAAFPASWEDIR